MKYKKFSSEYIVIVLVGILLFITLVLFPNHPKPPKSHPAPLPKPVVVKPTNPAPNKVQAAFTTVYRVDNLSYQVASSYSYFDASHSLQYATFTVSYENYLKQTTTLSPGANLNIGCIAASGQSFQQVPSIFTNGGLSTRRTGFPTTSLVAWSKQRGYTLQSYETANIQFEVNGDCQFIGTQDGEYWWPMPQFGV